MKSTTCSILGSLVLASLALGAALLAGCSDKPQGGSGSSAAASGKSAGAVLDEASEAIDQNDWKRALALVDVVIADPKATAEEKASAWQNKIVGAARVNGDDAAIAALKKMDEAKVVLTSTQFARIVLGLGDADKLNAAVAVMATATERFKSDPANKEKLEKLAEQLKEKMEKKGDTELIAKLRGLGYLGGK